MSRLVKDDIQSISDEIEAYDLRFKEQTGYFMDEVARKTVHLSDVPSPYRTAVISLTSGLGVISGFAEAVCAILRHCSADAFVTKASDVDGIYEGVMKGADILFLADDARFVALSVSARALAENGECTGVGFAEALACCMGCRREKVLVLGASEVGGAAAAYLAGRGIPVDIFDTNPNVLRGMKIPGGKITKLDAAPRLREYRYLYDATTAADLITAGDVSGDTVIAAPGMPRGITEEACRIATVIHNPLELGVIAMYYKCASIMESRKGECDC